MVTDPQPLISKARKNEREHFTVPRSGDAFEQFQCCIIGRIFEASLEIFGEE